MSACSNLFINHASGIPSLSCLPFFYLYYASFFYRRILIYFFYIHFLLSLAATQDVSVVRIEPDPLQELPCPQQMIEFRCQILVPSFAMQWTLPTGETLEFGGEMDIGTVAISSDNAYSATLRDRTGDPNSNNRFFFTSTLLVCVPVNGSNVTCVGLSGAVPVKENTSIIISGKNCCKQISPMYNFA